VALLDDPRVHERFREYARRFNVDAMVESYRALYESVLEEQALPRAVCP
jgi:hypothetical protein